MKSTANATLSLAAAIALMVIGGQAHAQSADPNCIPGDVVDSDGNTVPPPRLNNLGYRAGAAGGSNVVLQVKAAYGDIDPTEIEDFAELVIGRIQGVADIFINGGLSDYNACRIRGFLQGAANELQDCIELHGAVCAQEGQVWAALSAALYCDLSAAFGGLVAVGLLPKNTEPGVCGSAFEDACETTFFDSVAGVPDDNGDLIDGLCPEFSADPYVEVFEETQFNQCIFEVVVEP